VEQNKVIVDLDEEIRVSAYGHHLQHWDQYIDMDSDWYRALIDVCAKYKAMGFVTYYENGTWWAAKTSTKS